MSSNYPAKIDDNTSLPPVIDGTTGINANIINQLRTAIIQIETALGVRPGSIYGTVKARLDFLEANGGGGGGGDGNAIAIQGRPVSATAPTTNAALVWNDTNSDWEPTVLTSDMIEAAFIASLSGGGFLEVSQTVVHPAFTASYNRTPTSVILTDNADILSKDVSSTPNSFSSNGTYTKNTFGASVIFTITASDGTASKTANTTSIWVQKTYYGVGSSGQTSAAFIQGLSGNFLTGTRATSFTVTAGSTEKIYFSCRSAYGTPTFSVGGFSGGFALVSNTISVTNAHGFTENYQLWESSNLGLGNTNVTVG